MSLDHTSVPIIMDALVEGLSRQTAGMGANGRDPHVDLTRLSNGAADQIIVGDINDGLYEAVSIKAGRKRFDEQYRIDISIVVVRQDLRDAIQCAMGLLEVLRNWLAEEPDVGTGIPSLRAHDIDWALSRTHDDSGRGYSVTIHAQPLVEARIV